MEDNEIIERAFERKFLYPGKQNAFDVNQYEDSTNRALIKLYLGGSFSIDLGTIAKMKLWQKTLLWHQATGILGINTYARVMLSFLLDLQDVQCREKMIQKEGLQMIKDDAYNDLVKDVKDAYAVRPTCSKGDDVLMRWVDGAFGSEMTEINLWTYWQGYGVRSPKILLIGQDWGCCEQFPQVIKNAQEIDNSYGKTSVQYLDDNQVFITDKNLVKLFAELGYEDIEHNRYKDLFFSNFCLGYRSAGNSGGFKNKWLENDSMFFVRLVEILRPNVVLCLGRTTYEAAAKATGFKPQIPATADGGFNAFIHSQLKSPIEFEGVPILALAHPGGMGTANRLRGVTPKPKETLDLQLEDWRLVKKFMEERVS